MEEDKNSPVNLSDYSPHQLLERKDDYSLSYIFFEGIHYCSELNIRSTQSKMPMDLILSNATQTSKVDINYDQNGSIGHMNVAQKQARMNRRFFSSTADETYGVDITGKQCNSLELANEAEEQTQMYQGERSNTNIFCYNPGHSSEAFERDNLNLQVEENKMQTVQTEIETRDANLLKTVENSMLKSFSANIKKNQTLKGKCVDAPRLPRPSTNHGLSSFATTNYADKTKKPTASERAHSINKGLKKEIPSGFDITKLKKPRGAIPVSKMLPSFRYKRELEASLKSSSISKDVNQSGSPMFFLDSIGAWNNGGNASNTIGGGLLQGNEMNPSLTGSSATESTATNQNRNMRKENTGGSDHSHEN